MIYTLIDFYLENKEYDNVALGTFDGVHKGHKKLIGKMPKNQKNLVISFDFCAPTIFETQENVNEIQEIDQTLDVLSVNLSGLNRYILHSKFKDFLKKLKIRKIFVGKDFKFGYNRVGDINYLKKNFEVEVVEFLKIDNQKVSSTKIKEELKNGIINKVNFYLEKPYYISGEVILGNQLGREIEFPTLNIKSNKILPKNGVYKTKTKIDNKIYLSITNIGFRPTINENNKEHLIETHIIDEFNQEIYGQNIIVYFYEKIRDEQKFSSIDELKYQINLDVKKVKGE